MASRKRPASRGFVNNIILESLLSGDKYGYEIIKEVEDKSNGKIILKQPSLYSSLKRFEAKGYITSYWGDSDIGGRRHYYTITEVGKNYFKKGHKEKKFELDDDKSSKPVVEQIKFDSNDEMSLSEKETSTDNVIIDTEDDNYNVFELLEQNKTKSEPTKIEITTPQHNNKEVSIQIDMFSSQQSQNEVSKEEVIDIERIQQLKLNDDQPTEQANINNDDKHEIPLIKEHSQEFFSWEDLKRKQIESTNEKRIEENKQPIKNQVVMDEYGILKVGETLDRNKKQKIFDNVGTRIDYNDPVIKKEKVEKKQPELTEEERALKNQKFNEKLEQLINQKTNTTSNNVTPKDNSSSDDDIDYKNILGDLLATEEDCKIVQNNNIENDIEDEVVEQAIKQVNSYNFVPKQQNFENSGFKFKPYATTTDENEKHSNFVLSNKVKLTYGIFMFVLLILQISTLFIVLKTQNLLYTTDYIFYGIAYGLSIVLLLICLIPYLIVPDKRKASSFKLSYSLLFGILLFLATCALTYALNTFAGLNSANVSLFSTKLLLPIILAINFILTPIIYKMILSDKKMY